MSELNNQIDALSLDIENIKNSLSILDDKINQIIAKLDEFTIIADESDDEDEYNTEWTPYSDDDNDEDEEYYDDDNDL
jgi:hypothetical protein